MENDSSLISIRYIKYYVITTNCSAKDKYTQHKFDTVCLFVDL